MKGEEEGLRQRRGHEAPKVKRSKEGGFKLLKNFFGKEEGEEEKNEKENEKECRAHIRTHERALREDPADAKTCRALVGWCVRAGKWEGAETHIIKYIVTNFPKVNMEPEDPPHYGASDDVGAGADGDEIANVCEIKRSADEEKSTNALDEQTKTGGAPRDETSQADAVGDRGEDSGHPSSSSRVAGTHTRAAASRTTPTPPTADVGAVEMLKLLASLYYRSSEYTKAVIFYGKAARLSGGPSVDTLKRIGMCYHQQGAFESAVGCYERALQADPKNEDALNLLALVLLDLHSAAASKAAKKRMRESHITDAEAAEGTEAAPNDNPSLRTQDLPKIIELVQRCLKLNPKNQQALLTLGQAYGASEKWEKAIKTFKSLLALAPTETNLTSLGAACLRARKSEEGLKYLKEAEKLNANSAELHMYLCQAHCQLWDRKSAAREFQRCVKCNPDAVQEHANCAVTLCSAGFEDDAVKIYSRFLETNPESRAAQAFEKEFGEPLWEGYPKKKIAAASIILVFAIYFLVVFIKRLM